MKFRNLLAPICGAVLFAACSKDDTPTKIDTEDSVGLSKVFYYKGSDTSVAPLYTDSIVYKTDGETVDKIIALYAGGQVVYTFSYNANKTVSYLKVRGVDATVTPINVDYRFVYKSNSTLLDTLSYIDNSVDPLNNFIHYTCAYNSKDQIVKITNVEYIAYNDEFHEYLFTDYLRNDATGKIDSISMQRHSLLTGYSKIKNSIKFNTVAGDSALPIKPAYLLVLALRHNNYPFTDARVNLFTRQYLMPKDDLLRSGALNYNRTDYPFAVNYTFDAKGMVNFFSYITDKAEPIGSTSFSIKLQYKN